MESREEILLRSLLRFYKSDDQHLSVVAKISRQKTIISLREMDSLVTNFSKNNKISYKLDDGRIFKMHLDYKAQLRGYSKKIFDPFCRRERIFLDFETKTPIFLKLEEINTYKNREDGIVTTIGQLNFFRWAINNNVIEYCFENKEAIDEEMENSDKKKKSKKLIKDVVKPMKELSISPTEEKVIIQFP